MSLFIYLFQKQSHQLARVIMYSKINKNKTRRTNNRILLETHNS